MMIQDIGVTNSILNLLGYGDPNETEYERNLFELIELGNTMKKTVISGLAKITSEGQEKSSAAKIIAEMDINEVGDFLACLREDLKLLKFIEDFCATRVKNHMHELGVNTVAFNQYMASLEGGHSTSYKFPNDLIKAQYQVSTPYEILRLKEVVGAVKVDSRKVIASTKKSKVEAG